MAREELVNSAVTFLQDPSFASAPLEKRIEFLQSKNLSQEEINIALSRTAEDRQPPSSPYASAPQRDQQQLYNRRPPGQYGYNPYAGWPMPPQPPPPEPPRRDWRDWFIMATVVSGASFGFYTLAQRYIKPLIAPPTPPQLEQDKTAIDEEFARAFALLDTLSSDTAALKQAEEARTQRLDTALAEVESVVTELKMANRRREDESQRTSGEVRALLQDRIPKAIDTIRESSDQRLGQLGKELYSLRTVISNRLGGGAGGSNSSLPPAAAIPVSPSPRQPQPQAADGVNGRASTSAASDNNMPESGLASAPTAPKTFTPENRKPSSPASNQTNTRNSFSDTNLPTPSSPHRADGASSPLSPLSGKPAIPAWQMAAAKAASAATQEGQE